MRKLRCRHLRFIISISTPSIPKRRSTSTSKAFPSTSKGTFAGQPALRSPNNVWVLFNKVAAPPATQPQTAFWHFGWHVTDVRATLDRYLKQNITLRAALHRHGEGTGTVFVSSDTYPGTGGVLGLTRAQSPTRRPRA